MRIIAFVFLLSTTSGLAADLSSAKAAHKKGHIPQALKEYEELANQGNVEAMYQLGVLKNRWIRGGTTVDARKLFHQAARNGHAPAQFRYGLALLRDQTYSGRELENAYYWIKKAADAGYTKSYNQLAYMHATGLGAKPDPVLANRYLKLAESHGFKPRPVNFADDSSREFRQSVTTLWDQKMSREPTRDSYFEMGCRYLYGEYVAKDAKKAVDLIKKAAEADYPPALAMLGFLYKFGIGLKQDAILASRWYRKAARFHADPGYCLSAPWPSNFATDVQKQPFGCQEWVAWYKREAIEKSNPDAAYNLGLLFLFGNGVEQNTQTAIEWLSKGPEEAKRSHLNPDEIYAASKIGFLIPINNRLRPLVLFDNVKKKFYSFKNGHGVQSIAMLYSVVDGTVLDSKSSRHYVSDSVDLKNGVWELDVGNVSITHSDIVSTSPTVINPKIEKKDSDLFAGVKKDEFNRDLFGKTDLDGNGLNEYWYEISLPHEGYIGIGVLVQDAKDQPPVYHETIVDPRC